MPDDRIWYLWTAKGQEGPYTPAELKAWRDGGHITDGWYVWREGLAGWQVIKDTPELIAALSQPAVLPVSQPPVKTSRSCPACHHDSEDLIKCTRCGVVFSEWGRSKTASKTTGIQPLAQQIDPITKVSVNTRLMNFIVDVIVTSLAGGFILFLLSPDTSKQPPLGLNLMVTGTVQFLYYWAFESALGRTPGKFITGTKVVMEDGSEPRAGAIAIRTLVRFIPLEPLSYFQYGKEDVWWHDMWSKTRVVKA